MANPINRQWLLASRPQGSVKLSDFTWHEQAFPPPELVDGELLVHNRYFLCAPTMRNFLNSTERSYRASVPIGGPISGVVGSEVIASRNPAFPVGCRVTTIAHWEDYSRLDPGRVEVPVYRVADDVSLEEMMGPLSLNSLTAYYGLIGIGKIQPGETVVISAAAGSVGSMACQIARILGCRVIGIAGGSAKCAWLRDTLQVDGAIDYKSEDLADRLAELCPQGVHVYFDNVGGAILDAVMDQMAVHGRVAVCGQLSAYDSDEPARGRFDMMKVVYRRIRIEGFVLGDYAAHVDGARAQLRDWLCAGRIQCRVDLRRGLRNLPAAFLDLFKGANEGTLLVENDTESAALCRSLA
jgi:NADPH-dependent curcumin reductase CurA